MKKLFLKKGLLVFSLLLIGIGGAKKASAHGYVESPVARGYQGALDKGEIGWNAAYQMYGNVITNPQSLEAPKGFPERGPRDGLIASAEGSGGQIGDHVLDSAGPNRWKKNNLNVGINTFTWYYTAPHRTSKWHYYMTKPGWDQNKALERKTLELIEEIPHDGSSSTNNLSHRITIPENRSGYHVILAVWDVYDTGNAFYNAIDVNVKNPGTLPPPVETAPTKPLQLQASEITTSSAKITWQSNEQAREYNIYRDSQKVATINSSQFNDRNLREETTYHYQVEAVGFNGKVSEKSEILTVSTPSSTVVDNQKPTAPKHVHSMSTTENSIDLMWAASTHFLGVKNYDIYRNNQKVGSSATTSFKDSGLEANTTYVYRIKAISLGGNISEASASFTVTTRQVELDQKLKKLTELRITENTDQMIAFTWQDNNTGIVNYRVYRDNMLLAVISANRKNFKDTDLQADKEYHYQVSAITATGEESPKSDVLIGKVASNSNQKMAWNSQKVYLAGAKVTFNGVEYIARWYTQNQQPDRSDVWKNISNTTLEWSPQKAYTAGEKVKYQGNTYIAQWWTKNNIPKTSFVWKKE